MPDAGSASAEAPTVPRLRPAPAPFAYGPVLAVVSIVAVLLLLLSHRYGYLSDELYFLAAGKNHLDWGYMDQQPLVPLLAAGADALVPGAVWALRVPAILATVCGIVFTALLARELGGDQRAQTLAAVMYALSPWLLLSGHWTTAATLEPPQWTAILWLVARWTRRYHQGQRRDETLLWAGIVAAVALQTKFQVVLLCAAILMTAGLVGPRALPRSPLLWVGAAVALMTTTPTLLWQAAHGWPALDMGAVVGAESDRLLLLPTALLYSGVLVGAVFCCYGLWQLCRSPVLHHFRFLGWTVAAVAVFYLAVSGRANYFASLYPVLFAAAAVGVRHSGARARWARRWVTWPAFAVSAIVAIAFLPIYPLETLTRHPELPNASRLYETGWPELTRTVADTYHALPPTTRRRTAIVGQTYHIAAAIEVLGPEYGLPRAYSPNRGYWFFGQPPAEADTVLYVGDGGALNDHFAHHQRLGTVDSEPLNLAQGVAITRYDGRVDPWRTMWPEIRTH